ncbi:MAG: hypothetical protein HYX27_22120 [Acidobacteria bacterium]|nr:hypothetical protein [Acidobacteriota bacterium]
MLHRVRAAVPFLYGLGLVWLNAYLVRHVFFLTFTGATHSMHGYWMALGRVLGDSWWRPQWVSYWAGGMPAELTYSPLVPWLGWHFGIYAVLAVVFVLGPAAAYWMAWQITGKPGWSFVAGLAYSLLSPTELIQPDAAFGWIRLLEPRRMYLTLIWDEAPHQLALAFVCIAAGAWARGWRGVAIAAIVLAALANPFGITAALLFALSFPQKLVPGTGFLAYLIVCPFYPPSLLGILQANGQLAPESAWTWTSWLALLIVAAGFAIVWHFARELRFFALLAWLTTAQVILFYRWDIHFLQQPGRYKSEMELALVLLAVFAFEKVLRGRPKWLLIGLAVLGTIGATQQVIRHRKFARNAIKQADPTAIIEYRAAQAVQGTVFTGGSLAHWMNAFADVRQYSGGSYATAPNIMQQKLSLELMAEPSWEKFVQRMQAVGVDSVLIPGLQSPEFWKPFAKDVLAGHLPIQWEERDTRLYTIPGVKPAVEWTASGHARAQGGVIHVNWDPDWHAYANGASVPTHKNEWGQLVVEAQGGVEIVYEPRWLTRIVSIIGIGLAVLYGKSGLSKLGQEG